MRKIILKIKRAINLFVVGILNRIFIIFMPLRENRVLFISDGRETLGGNLEFVYNYLSDDKYEKVLSLKKIVEFIEHYEKKFKW